MIFDSRMVRSTICESMLSVGVAMENHSALRAELLCGRAALNNYLLPVTNSVKNFTEFELFMGPFISK